MKIRTQVFAGVLMLGILAGCASPTTSRDEVPAVLPGDQRTSPVRCNFARDHNLPATGQPGTFAFDTDSQRRGTRAYENLCDQVAAALSAYGWRRVDANDKPTTETPDYWVTVVYGYSLDRNANPGSFKRLAAPALVSDVASASGDFYGRIAAYYTGLSIATQPLGEGDTKFVAQIFGSSEAEMVLVLPTMLKQLLKDFPGELVKDQGIVLHTRR